MKLSAYPNYKPSGVDWVGDLPSGWRLKRLKVSVQLKDRKVEADPDEPLPYIGMENIESWTGRLLPIDSKIVPEGTANAFEKKHALFGKLRPYLAKACNPSFDGLCSTELLVLEPIELDRRNLLYSLLSDGFIKLVDSSTFGSKMPRANWDFIGNCVLPIPPPDEQRVIADFLDRETARLDILVGKKRELIEKLKEKRTALTSRTVTRGLNPNVKLKSSGIEWLGDIPEHWDVARIKYVAKVESGHTPARSVEEYWVDCSIPWVSLNDSAALRKRDSISETRYQINELGLANSSARLLPPMAVVFSRDATVGLCAITTKQMAVSQHFVAYLCGPKLLPKYLLQTLKAMSQHLQSLSTGSTIPTIGMPEVRSLACALPPVVEQVAIIEYLDSETAKLDHMMEKVEAAIEKLQEYRTALITAAVTGKIDVRNSASAIDPPHHTH